MSTNKTFKILGLLLSYPSRDIVDALDECSVILKSEALLPADHFAPIEALIATLKNTDLLSLETEYVGFFDMNNRLSLHLFEHTYGDSRDRGQAMVDMMSYYAEAGLQFAAKELPDYLPVFLEFLSTRPLETARKALGRQVNILSILATRLHKNESAYAAIFDALVFLSGVKPNGEIVVAVLEKTGHERLTGDQLDREWEEKPAF